MPLLRETLERHCTRLGIDAGDFEGVSMLLRDGHFTGRRFRWSRAQAVWFAEESEAKLYDGQGRLVARIAVVDASSRELATTSRHAA